jgi:formamidopyrimidine-DNA glycosylase
MPELPEVERGRRVAESVAAGRRIRRVECADDPIVFDGVDPAELEALLSGRRVEEVCRRGKQLWFRLDRPPHPLFHFGMTGSFRVPDTAPLQLASSPRGGEPAIWPPRFTKIQLWFSGGGELAMTNARRLGRIRLREDPLSEPPLSRLGPDPLLEMPSPADFASRLRARGGRLKSVLLDQGFVAGVGNWIADEVLYQAKIDPRRRGSSLTEKEARTVGRVLARIIRRAVDVDAEKDRLPRTWLFHRRWGKDPEARTARGEAIEFLEIGGRTTAWVPEVQG